jgi:hypothetical protein
VPPEGTQYGRYLLAYPTTVLATSANNGRNLLNETNFYREAAAYLLYSTSPGPLTARTSSDTSYQLFPSDDDEMSVGSPAAADAYYADFMTEFAVLQAGTPMAAYARQWLAQTGAASRTDNYVAAADPGGPAQSYSSLPLDYYAAGPGYLYAKGGWSNGSTSLELAMGFPATTAHSHLDAGSFQISRGGQWLTANTIGYSSMVNGDGGTGQAEIRSPIANNSVLVNGRGMADAYASPDYVNGPPVVTRMESRPGDAFASVDLSAAYRAVNSAYPERDDNPAVASVVRDFVYVRGMDALVILDRVASTTPSATKTFLLHFPNAPVVTGNTAVGTNGNQALVLTNLTPAGQAPAAMRVVNEAANSDNDPATDYQYRLEQETSGRSQSYMINVLQARDAGGANLSATMTEDAQGFTITLTSASGQRAVVQLAKGMASTGGAFGYSAGGGSPALTPLLGYVQGMNVTDQGPVWDSLTPGKPVNPAAVSPSAPVVAPAVVPVAVAMTASPSPGAGATQVAPSGAVTFAAPAPLGSPTESASGVPLGKPGSHGHVVHFPLKANERTRPAAAWDRHSPPGQSVASTGHLTGTSMFKSHGASHPTGARGLHRRHR